MKTILHLCADTGSDSYPYQLDPEYDVIRIGIEIGVQNYSPDREIHGVIANPVCTEFSFAKYLFEQDEEKGMYLVNHCLRIIKEANPMWWVLENPATGSLKDKLGQPQYQYQPWWYGSGWTKRTALWGEFNIPERVYDKWEDVPKIEGLYIRPGRPKPSLAFCHKSHKRFIREFDPFEADTDSAFRSLCSQKFAQAFKEVNI